MKSVFPVTIRDRATGYELTTEIRFESGRVNSPFTYGPGLIIPAKVSTDQHVVESLVRIERRVTALAAFLDVRRRRRQ